MYAVGIDIGGTKIAAALVAPDGSIIREAKAPTPAQDSSAIVQTVVGERDEIVNVAGNGRARFHRADVHVRPGGAREAAAVVLLDDSFASLVAAIRQGRTIYDNLQKAIFFILGIHVAIAGLTMLPVVFKLPLLLLPVHIVFLEL